MHATTRSKSATPGRALVLLAEGRRDEADALAAGLLQLGPEIAVSLVLFEGDPRRGQRVGWSPSTR
jgi:hypothetical protein